MEVSNYLDFPLEKKPSHGSILTVRHFFFIFINLRGKNRAKNECWDELSKKKRQKMVMHCIYNLSRGLKGYVLKSLSPRFVMYVTF